MERQVFLSPDPASGEDGSIPSVPCHAFAGPLCPCAQSQRPPIPTTEPRPRAGSNPGAAQDGRCHQQWPGRDISLNRLVLRIGGAIVLAHPGMP